MTVITVAASVSVVLAAIGSVWHWLKHHAVVVVRQPSKETVVEKGPLNYLDVQSGLGRLLKDARDFDPTHIFGINRGGAIVGGMLAKRLGLSHINLLYVNCDYEAGFRVQEQALGDRLSPRRILLVDDAKRKGEHMREAHSYLQNTYPAAEIRERSVLLELDPLPHEGPEPVSFHTPCVERAGFTTQDHTVLLPWDSTGMSGPDVSSCSFCLKFWVRDSPHKAWFDREIWGDESFAVVSGIGSPCPGYLLVLTRRHHSSLLSLPRMARGRLLEILNTVSELFTSVYAKPMLCFEHGSDARPQAGPCIDHAHMHLLPWEGSLSLGLADSEPAWEGLRGGLTVQPSTPTKEYFLLLCPSVDSWQYAVAPVLRPQSQFFRKAIFGSIGEADEWDWALHPRYQLTRQTLTDLQDRLILP